MYHVLLRIDVQIGMYQASTPFSAFFSKQSRSKRFILWVCSLLDAIQ